MTEPANPQFAPSAADAGTDTVLDFGAAYAQRRASQAKTMREGVAAPASPWRLLPSTAAGHLAHELRGSLHIIRGHADLLEGVATPDETHESARFILDASARLGGLCEDVVDFLRLPDVVPELPVALALDELDAMLARVATDRGVSVRVAGFAIDSSELRVDATVRRLVSHVLEQAVRGSDSEIFITVTITPSRTSCVIAVSPAPVGAARGDDGIIAMAADVLAAHGADIDVEVNRMMLRFPVVG